MMMLLIGIITLTTYCLLIGVCLLLNLGYSIFELLYGRQMRGPLEQFYNRIVKKVEVPLDALPFVEKWSARMQSIAAEVRKIDLAQEKKEKEYYDAKAVDKSIAVGPDVLLLNPVKSGKFDLEWVGPFKV